MEDKKPGEEPRTGEKRPADAPVDEEDTRVWKLKRKTASVGLGDLYDPGELPIKLKPKKEAVSEQANGSGSSGAGAGLSLGGTEKPKWSARGWSKPGASPSATIPGQAVKVEDAPDQEESGPVLEKVPIESVSENRPEVKTEEIKSEQVEATAPPPPSGGSLFKKRKAPAGGGSRGGRRI